MSGRSNVLLERTYGAGTWLGCKPRLKPSDDLISVRVLFYTFGFGKLEGGGT